MLLEQPQCILDHILTSVTSLKDRTQLSLTCRAFSERSRQVYNVFGFAHSPRTIAGLSSSTFAFDSPMPVIVIITPGIRCAVGWTGKDVAAVFYNQHTIVRVVRSNAAKKSMWVESLYSPVVQRMIVQCAYFKDHCVIVNRANTLDSVEQLTRIVNAFAQQAMRKAGLCKVDMELFDDTNNRLVRTNLLEAMIGIATRARLRENAAIVSGNDFWRNHWSIRLLQDFHREYLSSRQHLDMYGRCLREHHQFILYHLKTTFASAFLDTFEDMDSTTPSCKRARHSTSPYSLHSSHQLSLAALNKRQIRLQHLLDQLGNQILLHQGDASGQGMFYRDAHLFCVYNDLRARLSNSLDDKQACIHILEQSASEFQSALQAVYDNEMRLVGHSLLRQASNVVRTEAFTCRTSGFTLMEAAHDQSAEAIMDAIISAIPYHATFSRKMFANVFARREFDKMCAVYADLTAKIDYDDCSGDDEMLLDCNTLLSELSTAKSSLQKECTDTENERTPAFAKCDVQASARSPSPISATPPSSPIYPQASVRDLSKKQGFYYDIVTGLPVSPDFANQLFSTWYDQKHLRILHDMLASQDWLNAMCYFLATARCLLAHNSAWTRECDRGDLVNMSEYLKDTAQVPATVACRVKATMIELSEMLASVWINDRQWGGIDNLVWKQWWIYGCAEVLSASSLCDANVLSQVVASVGVW
ncbi:hypothetical protein BZG36_05563 [Bifiguratus adelaidae]|uniref:Uncharacterized protein n=1 Tax=Bifiguratus adelaidae TaxID=1938954 RepID=A0A261XTF9_9FUNG|nr:hypothetical protein BZG36_05563 [Bifiguratus adelaidae]